jgi:hypothetical protein
MSTNDFPFSASRASQMLREALTNYTAAHKGGLRALSDRLEMRPATLLSHMGNGRMAIPLDRADQLATVLGIDRAAFCLAVLEQRAPSAYHAIDDATGVGSLGVCIPTLARQALQILSASAESGEALIKLLRRGAGVASPLEHWVEGEELELIAAVRRVVKGKLAPADRRTIVDLVELVIGGE